MKNPKSKFTLKQSRHSQFGLSSGIFSPFKPTPTPPPLFSVRLEAFSQKNASSTNTFSQQVFPPGTLMDGDYVVLVLSGNGGFNPFSFNSVTDTQGNTWDNVGQRVANPWMGLASAVYSVWKCDRYSGDGSLTINASCTEVITTFSVDSFKFGNGSTNAFISQSSTFNNTGTGPNSQICNISTVVNDFIWGVLAVDNNLGGNAVGSPLAVTPTFQLFWLNNQSLVGAEIIDTDPSVSGNWAGIGVVFQANNP